VARSRRPWARIAARGGALGASAAMLLGLALVLERDDKTAGVASMFVGLAGLALSALALARPREPPPQPPLVPDAVRLDRAAETLATAVQVQWEAEAGLRALHRSTPLEDRATWQPALHASERAVALEQPTRVVERGLGIEL